ncbi:MAG: Rrf2 family transcriptional regulator [Variovorax sp.]|nr:Rrf2 family transcriptional regulator [Variovorax sp.]
MWVTRRSQVAVAAMLDLAMQPSTKRIALPEMSERHGVSMTFCEEIFARLRSEGLVSAMRGRGGGYVLARPATMISIADIVVAVGVCRSSDSEDVWPRRSHGTLEVDVWDSLGKYGLSLLKAVTLHTLAVKYLAGTAPVVVERRIKPLDSRARSPLPSAPSSVFELANFC